MHWVVATWLIASLLGLGMGHNTLFEGYDRTLSGYHLCNVTEHVSVTNVISYPTSYTQRRPCGGWLPWAMCDVMVYKTEYKTQVYNMSKQVMKCCHGYEQVGSYCALSLNRSAEFTSKPGLCPSTSVTRSLWNNSNSSGSMCKWDIDCSQWQKCCQTENIYQCSYPVPPAYRTCFNVTITVKTSFQLVTMDEGLFNHTRLLHSVVTGALGTAEISVHHVRSWSAGPFTTSSSLLVCSSNVYFLEDISTRLRLLGNIEEVTSVDVQAPSVTVRPFMNNTTPSSITRPPPGNRTITDGEQTSPIPSGPFWTSTVDPSSRSNNPSISLPPSTCDYIPEITSLFAYDVNASTFHVAWTTNNQTGITFHLLLLQGNIVLENISHVGNFSWMFNILNPAVLYTVRVTPFVCGNQGNSKEITVRTDGQSLLATARLTNMNYTKALSDPNSDAYKEFCRSVIVEILLYLPPETRALVNSSQVIIQITSLSAGSVIVHFSIIFQPSSNLTMSSMSRDFIASLQKSTTYTVDSIYTEDLNECLAAEADCSPWASCENTNGSYTCACWSGYTDLSPSRPGRSCAASPNATTINPTKNYPGVSSNSTGTDTTTSITKTTFGNPSMYSTVSTTHVQNITKTTVSSTSTTTRLTTMPANITTTILTPMTSHTTAGPLIAYVAVECSPGYISVFIRRHIFMAYSILETALYLGKPECVLNGRNESHVWVTTAWDKCGIKLVHNSTHNSFNVTLYNNVSVASNVHLEVPIICTYPSRITISTGYDPPGYFNMINDPVAGLGSFQVTVRLLNGTSPLPENSALYPDDEVIVEVAINTSISQIKVVISKCWATSSNNSSESPSHLFLLDGCAVADYTTVLQNGNSTVSLLSVQIFSLVNLDVIYLHCQIQICVEIQENTCRPDCMGRAYRASNLIGLTKASVGPLNRLHKASPQTDTSDTLQTIGFVLLGVGVFLFSLAAIAGLVYHKRKIGVYNFNFKPQQENFSYNVFST
ncbi:uromodulin-like 1 [Rhinichthys klamathensis goyatoka]|uniref:uromodulin-like 1 n=1 Tax=Rhinichthys klamathensis goyatoka TaxID=3034132 RepID=UPI0024B591B7|nr:uromodulin-like 1 [Rhinichthys klamathensis goyatoka]